MIRDKTRCGYCKLLYWKISQHKVKCKRNPVNKPIKNFLERMFT